jgi:hypothetical protein
VGVKVRVTGVLRVDVAAPLDDQERTALGQRRLQRHHRDEAAGEVRGDVTLVHAFGDEIPAAGTPDGVDTPGAVLYVVRDLSEAVPTGAEAVVLGTRRWYDALSTAGVLVSALDPPPWFRARPGQRVLRPRADPA